MTLWQELQWRGYYYQSTDDKTLEHLFAKKDLCAYVGLDPTAESLHIGHFMPLYVMSHFYRFGHKPIILLGAGTAKVGDPSGKSKIRPLIDYEELKKNTEKIEMQIKTIYSCIKVDATFLDNSQWLDPLSYISFIRDIGRHFSVSRMLSFETYKNRLRTGLSFLEFNYQLLQSYDFLHLYESHACLLQFGGADQWANIVAGTELIRRVHGKECYGYTVPLITRSDGAKMGKTEDGAIFIDPHLTSFFDFYQYWRNVDDKDCNRFFKLYTFLPKREIDFWDTLQDQELNVAKEVLAYNVCNIIHGEEKAWEILMSAHAMFSHEVQNSVIVNILKNNSGELSRESIALLERIIHKHISLHKEQQNVPTLRIPMHDLQAGIPIVDAFFQSGLCSSKSEARRLITQGGARIADTVVSSIDRTLNIEDMSQNNDIILKSGKKKIVRLEFLE